MHQAGDTRKLWAAAGTVAANLGDLGKKQRAWRDEATANGSPAADLASKADHLSAGHIREGLRKHFQGDRIVGEELPAEGEPGDRVWVVDPLDGTRNYAGGLPIWGVSVALLVAGRPAAGVFYLPDVDETFAAVRGGGATLNGHPLRAPPRERLLHTDLVAVGSLDFPRTLRGALIRRLGCTGAELCYLAAGRLAALHLWNPRLWDVAAGLLIAEEAGARLGRTDGEGIWPWNPADIHCASSLVGWAPGLDDPRPPPSR